MRKMLESCFRSVKREVLTILYLKLAIDNRKADIRSVKIFLLMKIEKDPTNCSHVDFEINQSKKISRQHAVILYNADTKRYGI